MNPDSPVNPSTPADIPAKADTEVRQKSMTMLLFAIAKPLYASESKTYLHKHKFFHENLHVQYNNKPG